MSVGIKTKFSYMSKKFFKYIARLLDKCPQGKSPQINANMNKGPYEQGLTQTNVYMTKTSFILFIKLFVSSVRGTFKGRGGLG